MPTKESRPWPNFNAFQEYFLNLTAPSEPDADLWTRGSLAAMSTRDRTNPHFPFVQLFEEYVVDEVALISSVDHHKARALRQETRSQLASDLRLEFEERANLPITHLINLAYVLISMSRFGLAGDVLQELGTRKARPLDEFERLFALWLIDNRRGGAESKRFFSMLREAISDSVIPESRQLEACTQAVVWFAKRNDVDAADIYWFADRGKRIVRVIEAQDNAPFAAVSSWYRGIAMMPALVGTEDVNSLMQRADDVLDVTAIDDVHQMIIRRTLLQSRLKQFCYVNPDYETAAQVARELIDADPSWSINWGDVGEMNQRFANPEEAAIAFDKAVALGPPYVRYHLRASAKTYASLGAKDEATTRYLALSDLGALPAPLAQEALDAASNEEAARLFRGMLRPCPDASR